MLVWKDEYAVGISLIDTQHQHLFEIGNNAYELLNGDFGEDKYDEVVQILDDLHQYAKFHFYSEEEFMTKIKYNQLFGQKVMHADFMEKLDEFQSNLTKNEELKKQAEELLTFLFDWLINHIIKKDRLIGE